MVGNMINIPKVIRRWNWFSTGTEPLDKLGLEHVEFNNEGFDSICSCIQFEPRREKTGLRGFRPGPTQTGLYKLRKELEA